MGFYRSQMMYSSESEKSEDFYVVSNMGNLVSNTNGEIIRFLGEYPTCLRNKFNAPVALGVSGGIGTDNCHYAIYGCGVFNSKITFLNRQIFNLDGMLQECGAYNRPFDGPINTYATTLVNAFANCSSFNQPIVFDFGSVSINCDFIFCNCISLNSPIYFNGGGDLSMTYAFKNCTGYSSDIYFARSYPSNTNYMFSNHPTSKRINIHYGNKSYDSYFRSIRIATSALKWTNFDNGIGCYNSTYNIYLYNNYNNYIPR